MNWWNPFDWGNIMIEGAKNKIEAILTELLNDIVLSSYWLCLIGGLIGIILFIFGCKKGKKMALVTPAIYVIIRILGSVILGV